MEKSPVPSEETTAATPPRPPGAGGMGLRVVFAALRRHPWLAAGVVVLALTAAAGVWFFLPNQKKSAYALFHIQSTQPHILNAGESGGLAAFNMYRQSQAALVKSRLVMNSALQNPAVRNSSLLRGVPDEVRAAKLEELAKVDLKSGGPEMMRLQFEGENEEELLVIVNAVAQAYLDDIVNKKRNAQARRQERLLAIQIRLQREVEQSAKRLANLRNEADNLDSPDSKLLLLERRSSLTQQQLQVEKELKQAQVELQLLSDPARPRVVLDAAAMANLRKDLLANSDYRKLHEQRDTKKANLDETRRRLAPGVVTPELTALEAEWKKLDDACQAKEAEARKLVEDAAQGVDAQTAAANRAKKQSTIKYCQEMLAKINADLKELAPGARASGSDPYGLGQLKLKHARDLDMLSRTEAELTGIQLEAEAPERVTKIDADINHPSESKRRAKYAGVAAAGILTLGLGGLVWREAKNPRVLDSRQLPGELGLPLIGVLPALQPRGPMFGGEAADDPNWRLAVGEAVNTARALLQYGQANGQSARTIMVGSALPGEGKTSLALLLANSLAQAGHQTLLIDGDLRRPSLHTCLDLPNRPGLCDYLAGGASEQEIFRPTATPGLSVIPGGQWSQKTSQGLATNLWPELLAEAAGRFDYVVIDSSPLLPVSDALLMARRVDGVLLSVMREVSEITPVKDALAQLALVGARVLGVVMNRGHAPSYYRSLYSSTPGETQPALS
jgi:capsular exopolysaccharide synthesis family protein